MAKTFEGIFGGIFDQGVYLRDSRHAANAFGLNKSDLSNGTPRHKFEFFVKINFNPQLTDYVRSFFVDPAEQAILHTMIKSITMPTMQIDTTTLNQYNKKRVSQTKINYNPISITFHDSVEGRTLRLWEMYYEYYFRDGLAPEKLAVGNSKPTSFLDAFVGAFTGQNGATANRISEEFKPDDTITDRFNDNYGYNLARVGNEKYLIDSIEIYQVHGGKFSRTDIIRPRVSNFQHDTLDYEDSAGLVELKLDFEYEGVVYANVNQKLNSDELEKYRYGDFHEMAGLITIRQNINGRTFGRPVPLPNVISCGPGSNPDAGDTKEDNQRTLGDTFTSFIGERNVNLLQGSISNLVGGIPGAISSVVTTSIFGGTVSFNPDPIKALKTTANQVSRNVVNSTRNNFASGLEAAAGTVVNGFVPTGDDSGG